MNGSVGGKRTATYRRLAWDGDDEAPAEALSDHSLTVETSALPDKSLNPTPGWLFRCL